MWRDKPDRLVFSKYQLGCRIVFLVCYVLGCGRGFLALGLRIVLVLAHSVLVLLRGHLEWLVRCGEFSCVLRLKFYLDRFCSACISVITVCMANCAAISPGGMPSCSSADCNSCTLELNANIRSAESWIGLQDMVRVTAAARGYGYDGRSGFRFCSHAMNSAVSASFCGNLFGVIGDGSYGFRPGVSSPGICPSGYVRGIGGSGGLGGSPSWFLRAVSMVKKNCFMFCGVMGFPGLSLSHWCMFIMNVHRW